MKIEREILTALLNCGVRDLEILIKKLEASERLFNIYIEDIISECMELFEEIEFNALHHTLDNYILAHIYADLGISEEAQERIENTRYYNYVDYHSGLNCVSSIYMYDTYEDFISECKKEIEEEIKEELSSS